MLKVYIDGKHFQNQMRNCEIKEGQEFHLRLVKIDHDRKGKWDIYFESITPGSGQEEAKCSECEYSGQIYCLHPLLKDKFLTCALPPGKTPSWCPQKPIRRTKTGVNRW